jgi:hypothetical protein
MSGGSFDYLCFKEIDELFNRESSIEDMADALAQLGYAEDAARATMDLLLEIRRSRVHLQAMKDKLEPVWKGIEWWHSCDTSEDTFKKVLDKYRGKV